MDTQKPLFEHEIPDGSRLYFKHSAKLKRDIENYAAHCFSEYEFDEIVTPYFSYHQDLSVAQGELLRFYDEHNASSALRGDSTIDVVRIIRRRLKDDVQKRWFYIQPVFKYPSREIYQIGAEMIGEDELKICIDIANLVFQKFKLKPTLQISNIEIPHLVCKLTGLEMSVFEKAQTYELLKHSQKWIGELERICSVDDIARVCKLVPSELKKPLCDMKELADLSGCKEIVLAPLYYSKMYYYDKMFFRFIDENRVLSSGGNYEIDGQNCSGFALFSDEIIQTLIRR